MKTQEMLDAVKSRAGISSDYAAAQLLGVTRAQMSRYRNGKDYPGDDQAMKIADLLAIDAGFIVSCIHAERASTDTTRALWEGIARRLNPAPATSGKTVRKSYFPSRIKPALPLDTLAPPFPWRLVRTPGPAGSLLAA